MELIRDLRSSAQRGLFYVGGGTAVQKLLVFVLSIVLVRLLSKEEFGQYSYARTIINFLYIFGGLGIQSGILQYCTRTDGASKRAAFLRYGMRIQLLTGLLLGFSILLVCRWFSLPVPGSTPILMIMAFIPLAYHPFTTGLQFLRSRLRNRQYAAMSALYGALALLLTSMGAWLFAVRGAAAFGYFALILATIPVYWLIRKDFSPESGSGRLEREERRAFLKYSVTDMLTGSVSQFLFIIDTFLVGLIIATPETVAAYKTATILPFALNFVPTSVMMFIFPYPVKMDAVEARATVVKIQRYLALLNAAIVAILVGFAPTIIRLLFGEQYGDSVLPFRILALGYFLAGTFRFSAGTAIASQLKIHYNLIVGILTTVLNVALDIWLIKAYGIVGAAVATVLSLAFSVALSNYYLYRRVLPGQGRP